MRLCAEASGCATIVDVRYLFAVNAEGRIVPTVVLDNRRPELIGLAHYGIAVVN